MDVPFIKMQALGNDFVIIDRRSHSTLLLDPQEIINICDRRQGIGCDQFIILTSHPQADCFMQIYNADGSPSNACGNATRCVSLLLGESAKIKVGKRILNSWLLDNNQVKVDMGVYNTHWRTIPLSKESPIPMEINGFLGFVINVGNPHFVTFVPNIEEVPITQIGPILEHHPIFANRANINFAQIISSDCIKLRVWERGAGLTLACGSGACATAVAAFLFKGLNPHLSIQFPYGTLQIHVDSGRLFMIGSAHKVFEGTFSLRGKN